MQMIWRYSEARIGYIDHPALSHDMGELYCINRLSFFQVMGGGIDMGARMRAQVQTGNAVIPTFLLPEYRGCIPRKSKSTFREWSGDVDNFHRLLTPPTLSDEGNESDSPMVFLNN